MTTLSEAIRSVAPGEVEHVLLSSVARIVSGGTPKTGEASFWNGDIPWATPKDLSGLASVEIHSTPRLITEAGLRNSSAEILPINSVLFSSRAPIGLLAINTTPMATNQGFKSFVPDPEKLDSRYLYRWLEANRAKLQNMGVGATFKEVSKAIVSRLVIPLPSLDEQRRIAAILDKADELRTKRRDALVNLDALTQSVFHTMFELSEKWPLSSVGLLADVVGGVQVSSKRGSLPVEVPYLRVANVYRGALDLEEIKTIRVTSKELNRVRLRSNDVLIVEGHGNPTEIGRCARWTGEIDDCVHQNHLIRARFGEEVINSTYAEHHLNSSKGRRHLVKSGKTTSGLNTISTSNVKDCPMPVPPIELQREFAHRVSAIQRVKNQFLSQLTDLDTLFASLENRAFKGEL